MARPPKNPHAPGIYKRGPWYWLRYSLNGREIFCSLRTQQYEEAVAKARELRGIQLIPTAKTKGGWDALIEQYLREKQNPQRPKNYRGKRWLTFRPGTVVKVRSCLKVFSRWACVSSPSKITTAKLEKYLQEVSKTSKAGGRTTLATIQAFLDHIGCLPGRIQLPDRKSLERREVVLSIKEGNKLIDSATNDNLKFVLYCGFHAGLRRGEIMHARKKWFDLDRGILRVPRIDQISDTVFQVKDRETREIPLSEGFSNFLKSFLKKVDRSGYCLVSSRKRRSKSGTYDFGVPFKKFLETAGYPEFFPHAMRHSWITELCNSGNHTIQEVSSWSGDSIETIEKNYWHKRAVAGALDDTMRGHRSGDSIKEIVGILKNSNTVGLNAELVAAIQNLVKASEKSPEVKWEWTSAVPKRHAKIYSVTETIADKDIFQVLIGTEDDQQISDKDWDEEALSTSQLRLALLKDFGYVRST